MVFDPRSVKSDPTPSNLVLTATESHTGPFCDDERLRWSGYFCVGNVQGYKCQDGPGEFFQCVSDAARQLSYVEGHQAALPGAALFESRWSRWLPLEGLHGRQ